MIAHTPGNFANEDKYLSVLTANNPGSRSVSESGEYSSNTPSRFPNFKIQTSTVVWPNDSLVQTLELREWPLKFWGVIWPKDSLVLGVSGQKTPWCQGWVSTKESFVQITPTPRSLLARSPLKTLKAIFRKSKKHQGVFCPDHCSCIFLLCYRLCNWKQKWKR